jgi:hypothetical protein
MTEVISTCGGSSLLHLILAVLSFHYSLVKVLDGVSAVLTTRQKTDPLALSVASSSSVVSTRVLILS